MDSVSDRRLIVVFGCGGEKDPAKRAPMGEVVGRKLSAASRRHQVLCVTHLPQIACFGDQPLLVQKRSLADRTETTVRVLAPEERPREVARMLGGSSRSATALDHANELLGAAARLKRRLKGTNG